jgi:hypothetical protein
MQRILATLIIEEAVGDGATGAALDAVARAARDEEFPGQAPSGHRSRGSSGTRLPSAR